jgi:hypothetical protein
VDEQFGKFIEVIKKLNVNIAFLKAMQVPTYAKYLKDILNNKSSIGSQHIENALCDLGASISVMPKLIYNKLNYTSLSPVDG